MLVDCKCDSEGKTKLEIADKLKIRMWSYAKEITRKEGDMGYTTLIFMIITLLLLVSQKDKCLRQSCPCTYLNIMIWRHMGGGGDIFISNLRTRGKWVAGFTNRRFNQRKKTWWPPERKRMWPQRRYERGGEEKYSCFCRESNWSHSAGTYSRHWASPAP